MIDDSYDNLFSSKKWAKFNTSTFKYAKCSTCTNKFGLSLIKDTRIFN